MDFREYLDQVTGQIRCRQARPLVEEELRRHLEDQADAFTADGMQEAEAREAAVREMGDPVEAGTLLDRVHRPRMEWGAFLLVAVLSAAGLLLNYLFFYRQGNTYRFGSQVVYTLIGFAVMLLIYRMDYTLLAKWAFAALAVLFLAAVPVGMEMFPLGHNRTRLFLYIVSLLFPPVYAAVLFRFRGKGAYAIGVSAGIILLFLMAVWHGGGATVLQTFLTPVILLITAAARGWFKVRPKRAVAGITGALIALPLILIPEIVRLNHVLGVLTEYQAARLKALAALTLGNGEELYGTDYLAGVLRDLLQNCRLVGATGVPAGNAVLAPANQNDYLITGLFAYYGILAGLLLLALIAFFLLRIFHIAHRQKNQMGSMVGLSCALIFACQSILYIYNNLRSGFIHQMSMPFLSSGFFCTVTNFILMGIFLSTYRGSTITDEKQMKKSRSWKLKLVREDM